MIDIYELAKQVEGVDKVLKVGSDYRIIVKRGFDKDSVSNELNSMIQDILFSFVHTKPRAKMSVPLGENL